LERWIRRWVLLGRGAWVATCFESGSRGLEEVYIVEFRRYYMAEYTSRFLNIGA
jgi:hypothetical protein